MEASQTQTTGSVSARGHWEVAASRRCRHDPKVVPWDWQRTGSKILELKLNEHETVLNATEQTLSIAVPLGAEWFNPGINRESFYQCRADKPWFSLRALLPHKVEFDLWFKRFYIYVVHIFYSSSRHTSVFLSGMKFMVSENSAPPGFNAALNKFE